MSPKKSIYRNWKPYYEKIISMYKKGLSPTDIGKIYNVRRESIKNIIVRKYKLRSQSEASKLAIKNGRKDKAIKALIESAKTTNRFNIKKIHHKENHPLWIKDRTKLKKERMKAEEKWFFKGLLKERNYSCELTNKSGRLSVHHIKPVWKYPKERFNKKYCIVILKEIHSLFHKIYGFKSDELDWKEFVMAI